MIGASVNFRLPHGSLLARVALVLGNPPFDRSTFSVSLRVSFTNQDTYSVPY